MSEIFEIFKDLEKIKYLARDHINAVYDIDVSCDSITFRYLNISNFVSNNLYVEHPFIRKPTESELTLIEDYIWSFIKQGPNRDNDSEIEEILKEIPLSERQSLLDKSRYILEDGSIMITFWSKTRIENKIIYKYSGDKDWWPILREANNILIAYDSRGFIDEQDLVGGHNLMKVHVRYKKTCENDFTRQFMREIKDVVEQSDSDLIAKLLSDHFNTAPHMLHWIGYVV